MVEEEIFYPAYKDATQSQEDRDMYFESIEEHHVVDMLLPELMPLDSSSDGFRAKAKVLKELIMHHAGEEEDDLFPKAQQLLGAARLDQLGAQMAARKNELSEKWSTRMGNMLHKAQSVAEKFAPTSMKDARVEKNREGKD
jgi:hemerythrin-like domain-containing protein